MQITLFLVVQPGFSYPRYEKPWGMFCLLQVFHAHLLIFIVNIFECLYTSFCYFMLSILLTNRVGICVWPRSGHVVLNRILVFWLTQNVTLCTNQKSILPPEFHPQYIFVNVRAVIQIFIVFGIPRLTLEINITDEHQQ